MVGPEEIERAVKVLQVHYGTAEIDRQLLNLQVDQVGLENLFNSTKDAIKERYQAAWYNMDPRIEPAINTALYHVFMTGLLVGRGERQRIE
jgi:hypothetical protein